MIHAQAHCCDEVTKHQLPIAAVFKVNLNSFHRGMFKLNANFDTDLLLYSLIHFECNGHTVHMLTQLLLPSLTITVNSSLFMHAESSPPFLASTLHLCRENHCHYINSGWTFSGQCSYVCMRTPHIHERVRDFIRRRGG